MIKCPNCQAKHPENALFCDECGAYLLAGDQEMMDTLIVAEAPRRDRGETSEVPGEEVTFPLGLKLTIPDSGRSLEVPLIEEVSIGRLDAASASYPDVDLSGEGGLKKGISRRHAKVTRRGREVFVEDLGSINGTLLNGKKLIPYRRQVLKSDDELQLGKLVLRVSFTG
jgi:pSer/pThr/pTyr-binding forkhead associated (FHA) protein